MALQQLRTWLALAAGAVVAIGGVAALAPVADPPVAANPGAPPGFGLVPSFADEFDGAALDTERWRTNFLGARGVSGPINRRTLPANGERQVYLDPDFLGLGVQPFEQAHGTLTITAQPMSPALIAALRPAIAALPRDQREGPIARVRYQSGLITSRGSFSQTYGYFEMRARLPTGKGLWPAFWLLPEDGSWPPEIDVVEVLGDAPTVAYQTIHSRVSPKSAATIAVPGPAGAFHRYGMLWLPDRIDFYLDGVRTFTAPTPADAHVPMHVLANLAVGGHWPGEPDAGTVFPARMEIDYIRAWRLGRR